MRKAALVGRRHLSCLVIAAAALLAGCATTIVTGHAVSVFNDPFRVAGLPATDGPTGLRDDAPPPDREVLGTDGSAIDDLGAQAISDIERFWSDAYPDAFGGTFTPVEEVHSWDSAGIDGVFCGSNTYGLVNAGYCFDDHQIGWDRGELLPALQRANGDMAVSMVLAHEYGHAVQHQAELVTPDTPTLVGEQQADCLAGAYVRWVAEGNSPRFTVSTADGLNNLLAAMIAFRDPLLDESDPEAGTDEHGSAFERVSAFQFGFSDGPSSCAAIDEREIDQRRGDLPVLLPADETGELPVTEDSVRSVVDAMGILFHPARPPALTFAAHDCADARMHPPASYCPADNTIVVDLPELEAVGTPSDADDGGGLASGDNTAYSILVSRYMQAIQHERGGTGHPVALDTAEAALRTACLTGVATVEMTEAITTTNGDTIALTAGDVDEAVSGILVNGLVASDVNGDSVPSGFSRIDAFRVGVLGDADRCFARFD